MPRTATAKKQPPKHKNITIDKVDVPRLKAFLETHGKEVEVSPGTDERIALIDAYQELLEELKKGGMEQFLACDACGGLSDPDLTECPVCGEGGAPGDETTPVTKSEVVEVEAEVVSNDEGPQEKVIVSKPEDSIQIQGTEADLDAAITRVKELLTENLRTSYDMGYALNDIYDRGLFKTRMDGDKSRYQEYNQFIEAETPFGRRYADMLRLVTKTFSRDDFEKAGVGRLNFLLQFKETPEQRAILLEKAREGTSIKALKREAERMFPAARQVSSGGGATRTERAQVPEPTTGGRDGAITCTFQRGKVELRLQTKGKDHIKEAKQDLINGVEATYTVDWKTGILTIVYKRVAQ